ncbi:hypothetical protein LBMAG52_35280 [Planctomycetia bacterium]|nr:hypothetical protein LBMAG52_35280 [Planctomycetia bacterium]
MPVAVTCECGHVTELADPDQPADAAVVAEQVCPACGRALATHAPAGKRMFQQLWQSHVGDASAPAVPIEPVVAPPVEDSVAAEPSKPRRSLWDVMRGSTITPAAQPPETTEPMADAVKPKGLWGVMQSTTSDESRGSPSALLPWSEGGRRPDEGRHDERLPQTNVASMEVDRHAVPHPQREEERPTHEPQTLPKAAELTLEQKYAQAASLASMTHVATSWQPESVEAPFEEDEREWSRRAMTALTFAVLTVLAATASYRPEWWWRGLALASGLVAVLLGFVAAADVRRSRGRLQGVWVARSSVLLGSLGMFLAPLVFARIGERQRANVGLEEVHWRLRRLGEGLNQFHAQQGQFPEAAIKGRDVHGDNVPMHGWMTPLLPSLGQDAVYRRIDLKQPFDAQANVPAMQQPIPEFSLPRRKPARSPRGFALTHFSGVGGQDVREPAGLVNFGMFNDSGPVKREQFTDGLSQTVIVGEVRDRDPPAPPWGEPGNVRSIGEGLNRQFRGFGNANGTGATFLHADGSVKFYSNKTDRRVLERLETRDGGERE